MSALNESRAWEQAHAPESLCPAETWAYMAAENSKGHSIARDFLTMQEAFPDPEDMPSMAPEPPRQVNVIVTATVALLVVAALLGWWIS